MLKSETSSNPRPLMALRKFKTDPELRRVEQILAEFDAFTFLGLSESEAIHSKVLAWLLDPRENHEVGELFLRNFLLETQAVTPEFVQVVDWTTTEVQREWHNIVNDRKGFLDILVLNHKARFACAIENKIFSAEHSEQLSRYRRALESAYPRHRRIHYFLSPQGTHPSSQKEQDHWKPVDYRKVLRLVELTIENGVVPENGAVLAFLRQYASTLRRRIVPDTNIRQLATRLYQRHGEAIELIRRHRDSYLKDLIEICKTAVGQNEGWTLVSEREGKLVGFLDKSWKGFSVCRTGTGWMPETDTLLLMDFDLRVSGVVTLILTISKGRDEEVRRRLFEMTQKYPELFNPRGSPLGGRYHSDYIRLYASEPILVEEDFYYWNAEAAQTKMMEWTKSFAESEFPKMNSTILRFLQEIESEHGIRVRQANGRK